MYSYMDEIIVDGFCGGGGASTGIEAAIGEPVTIGINHDKAAIAMHKRNHPQTKHYNESIFDVDPHEACRGRPVGWAHFSPDCTHFSVAKGGKPVKKSIRGLAWVITKWAGTVHPRIISMENVKEFVSWCPLVAKRDKETGRVLKADGTVAAKGEYVPYNEQQLVPDAKRKGETFRKLIKAMEALGYEVEWRLLTASDYGAPTIRKRLFILFRADGVKINWPKPTHGDPKAEGFSKKRLKPWRTAYECIEWQETITSIFDRKKPLADATMRRIARGIKKYVIDNPQPFIMLIGQTSVIDRSASINTPLRTVVSKNEHCLVAPIITQYHGETSLKDTRGDTIDKPMRTVDTSNRYGLVTSFIVKNYGGGYKGAGSAVTEPVHTVTAVDHNSLVTAFVSKYYGNDGINSSSISEPLHTITAKDRCGLVTASFISRQFGMSIGHGIDQPMGTATGCNKSTLVQLFLEKHGIGIDVVIGKEKYRIVDICMRMLRPRELYRSHGFSDNYVIDEDCFGNRITIAEQVKKVGNSVPPPFMEALVKANWPERCSAACKCA